MSCLKLIKNTFSNIRENLLKYQGGQVIIDKDEGTGIALICLDHPEKRNAMSGKMMVEFRDCIDDLEKWEEGKGLILTGKGNNFCSGGDLDFAKVSTPQDGLDMSIWMQDALIRLQRLPLITVCLVHGPCLGGGSELSVFCDYIVVADNVKYAFVQGKMGIITAWGGGARLIQRIGYSKALDILLTSRVMDAKGCVDIGLAEHIVTSPVQIAEVRNWLQSRLLHPYEVVRAFKRIACNTQFYNYEDAMRMEQDIFAPLWGGEINKEVLKNKIKHS